MMMMRRIMKVRENQFQLNRSVFSSDVSLSILFCVDVIVQLIAQHIFYIYI